MSVESIPADVSRLITAYISSVEQLELLCLLGEKAHRSWTAAQVLQIIQSSEKSIAECLERYRRAGLLQAEHDGSFRFLPTDSSLAQTVAALVKTYRERRVSVIEYIYNKAADPIQDFADAFRLRKEN